MRTSLPYFLGTVASAGFVLFMAIQVVPYGHDTVNPPVRTEPAWDSPRTRTLALRACFDCHSNETVWPVYARIAPVSWLVQHDVTEARAALNFSEWQRPQQHARKAAEEVSEGEMPMQLYALMHRHARLTGAERDALVQGLARTIGARREQYRAGDDDAD